MDCIIFCAKYKKTRLNHKVTLSATALDAVIAIEISRVRALFRAVARRYRFVQTAALHCREKKRKKLLTFQPKYDTMIQVSWIGTFSALCVGG